jgi:Tfp pilus assembly protein PilN
MDANVKELERKIDAIVKAESPLQKYFIQVVMLVFLAGGGWMTLDSVSALAQENKEAIAEEHEDVAEIDKKLVRIETKQEQMKAQLERATRTAEANARKLDKILNKLEDD